MELLRKCGTRDQLVFWPVIETLVTIIGHRTLLANLSTAKFDFNKIRNALGWLSGSIMDGQWLLVWQSQTIKLGSIIVNPG